VLSWRAFPSVPALRSTNSRRIAPRCSSASQPPLHDGAVIGRLIGRRSCILVSLRLRSPEPRGASKFQTFFWWFVIRNICRLAAGARNIHAADYYFEFGVVQFALCLMRSIPQDGGARLSRTAPVLRTRMSSEKRHSFYSVCISSGRTIRSLVGHTGATLSPPL
jgi:hypothetical protein